MSMKVDPNWFLFVEEKEIRWSFGNPDEEFKGFVINFLAGLAQIGEEIFGENGVASIEFDLPKKSQVLSSEIFIVNLSNKFFIIMSDPSITMKMLNQQGGIAPEVEEILSAVLVGQAAILFGTSISEVSSDDESSKIKKVWQNIILDISAKYTDDIDKIVSSNSSNFSRLAFEDLLFLHYHLRKQLELGKIVSPKGWSLVSHYSGSEIPLEHNMEWDAVVLAGYLGIIISFITALFNSKPKTLTFGTHTVQTLCFINGKDDYFIAIDSPFTKLILESEFQTKFFALQEEVITDLHDALRKRIIEEILAANAEELENQNLVSLLQDNVLSRKTLFKRLFSRKKRLDFR